MRSRPVGIGDGLDERAFFIRRLLELGLEALNVRFIRFDAVVGQEVGFAL